MDIPTSQVEAMRIGVPKYKTGKPCKYGHVSARWTLTSNCCQCTVDRVNAKRAAFKAVVAKNESESF